MSIHQHNPNKKDDELFQKGHLGFLKVGNSCRLLDGRSTPGYIEQISIEDGMFHWRITDFEDKGKTWELPFEQISKYEFDETAIQNDKDTVQQYKDVVAMKKQEVIIEPNNGNRNHTLKQVQMVKKDVIQWLNKNSTFLKQHDSLDITRKKGYPSLFDDVKQYFLEIDLFDLEQETQEGFCLNPGSGELILGMKIVLAEMGLVRYDGLLPRKKDTFEGIYSKQRRRQYLIHRLAFVWAMFDSVGIDQLTVYRGMTSSLPLMVRSYPLLSTTISLETAKEFFDETPNKKHKSAYLMKLLVEPSQCLFTYFETEAFSKQYLEQEVVLLNDSICPL